MLKEAIQLQKDAVNKLLENLKEKDNITFKAPTGSGKTYMMADFMNQVLSKNSNVVFIVSTLSKGNLAEQNYEKFVSYAQSGKFPFLKSYLINTQISGEQSLYIPTNYNVYLLPRDLYKKNGRLMKGCIEQFLNTLTMNKIFNGLEKHIYVIKDECHIATNNLDSLSNSFFDKIINFSATPNLKRGQTPDIEITEEEAEEVKLIKRIEFGEETETVEDAIKKFEDIKKQYRNLLGINPCLIIQISNKNKATEELENTIFPILEKSEHQDLKWMLIVDKEKECNTNDIFKAKKMPTKKWKDYAKENTSTIDIIIFKMVISEGWDIPRACMLYQVRETESEQLDEQVMGRVRRNPRLLDFENLNEEAKKLATTSWIWGKLTENAKKVRSVKLYDECTDITNNVKIKTTVLKPLTKKKSFDINEFINKQPENLDYEDIFTIHKKLQETDNEIQDLCYKYADTYEKWWKYNSNLKKILTENNNYICDYSESMDLQKDENGSEIEVCFPQKSSYVDNGNYENISDWVWKRTDGINKFSFDSEAEREWADILKELSNKELIKRATTSKSTSKYELISIFNGEENEKIHKEQKFLWGKNFITNSNIKFQYYLNGIYSSYPDFIMVDSYERIHIFEVKSLNVSKNPLISIDTQQYKRKIEELKKCYMQASILTGHIFYLPVLKDNVWYITQYKNGKENNITKEQFVKFIAHNEEE